MGWEKGAEFDEAEPRGITIRFFSSTSLGRLLPTLPACAAANEREEEGATMLVLSRHRDESIMIGDDIVVTIVDIRGDKVRLGINAPQDIPVHRQEVFEAIKRESRNTPDARPS